MFCSPSLSRRTLKSKGEILSPMTPFRIKITHLYPNIRINKTKKVNLMQNQDFFLSQNTIKFPRIH
jgi:hypothetical protein